MTKPSTFQGYKLDPLLRKPNQTKTNLGADHAYTVLGELVIIGGVRCLVAQGIPCILAL
jgi:hypothetical protein